MSRFFQFIWLAPRNLVILLVKGYRKAISPLYGDVCRYYPTCSAYGLQQFQQRGVILGAVLTVFRIVRCNPWSQGGVDYVDAHLDCADVKNSIMVKKEVVGAN